MVAEFAECKDWALRERLLDNLRQRSKEELFRALEIITEYVEGEETFRELLDLLAK